MFWKVGYKLQSKRVRVLTRCPERKRRKNPIGRKKKKSTPTGLRGKERRTGVHDRRRVATGMGGVGQIGGGQKWAKEIHRSEAKRKRKDR